MGPDIIRAFNNHHHENRGKNHRIAFAVPGLVFGFNYSILDALETIRQITKQDKIYLYLYTWKTDYNLPFLKSLEKLTNSRSGQYPNIELKYKISTYEDSELVTIAHKLMKDLGCDTPINGENLNFDESNFKRLVYFYSHYRLYRYILRDTSKYSFDDYGIPLVIKVSSKLRFQTNSFLNSRLLSILHKMFEYLYKHVGIEGLEKIDHPYDVLYTTDSGSTYYEDMLYASSPKTLVNIFGNSDEEFYQKLLNFYQHHIHRFPGNLHTDEDLTIFGRNHSMLPLEGSTIFKHFADNSKIPVVNSSNRYFGDIIKAPLSIKSPWYYIVNDEIWPPDMVKEDKLLKQLLDPKANKGEYIIGATRTI